MQDLTVIGIENGALLVSSETGERFRVAIDEVLQSRLRQSTSSTAPGIKVSPREIQSQIRAGMSAEDVARSTGASLEYVERFEGPVVAERLHIVSSALRVAVKVASSTDPLRGDPLGDDQSSTFGEIIEERLAGLGATDLRWASWKEESGWIVKLTFTASEIDHDARWQYDAKRHSLTPLNSGAVTLSQHGEISDGLIPRLRAVDLNGNETTPIAPLPRAETTGLGMAELDVAIPGDAGADAGSTSRSGSGSGSPAFPGSADADADRTSAVAESEEQRPDSGTADAPAAAAATKPRSEGSAARSIWGAVSRSVSKGDSSRETPRDTARDAASGPAAPPVIAQPTPFARPASRTDQESSARAAAAAVNRATPAPATHNETADLLEALRRRRGERESASFIDDGDELDSFDDSRSEHPSAAHAGMFTRGSSGLPQGDTRPVAHLKPVAGDASDRPADGGSGSAPGGPASPVGADAQAGSGSPDGAATPDVPLAGLESEPSAAAKQRQTAPQSRRKTRASMPSWDEIVFGARSDDDLS
ncbi:septation protein SepH [Subtercola sp. Z020]|uniref:septation protein SepH n=1 Tax=Subtercola sp. Z020 TaxID=2080582 RepID=UPI001E3BEA55|nr:septation protein SepH [Subtercola sp. Z020]